jgi:hypothetical protein
VLYHWLDAQGLTTAAIAELRAMLPGVLASMLVMLVALAPATQAAGFRVKHRALAACTLAAWVYLGGLALPMYYTSAHSSGCRINVTATLLAPLLVFAIAFLRCKLTHGCTNQGAACVAVLAEFGLLLSVITLCVTAPDVGGYLTPLF